MISIILLLFLFVYLLAFPTSVSESVFFGINLWYHHILPVLFPFMIICSIWLHLFSTPIFPDPLIRIIQKLFRCSMDGSNVILPGFLCGFPIGAKISSDLYRQNRISKEEFIDLITFTNNVSPAFLLNYLATEQMHMPELKWTFVTNVLGASCLYGILSGHFRKTPGNRPLKPNHDLYQSHTFDFSAIEKSITSSVQAILTLAGYLVTFSILSGILAKIIPLNNPFLLITVSSMEITKGISMIVSSSQSFLYKYLAVNALASFGGISALYQTAAIASFSRDMLCEYTKSRAIITLLCIILSYIQYLFFI